MKIIKSALLLVILTFATALAQPLLPPGRSAGNLKNDLNLSDSQKEKIEKILTQKRIKLDNIRNRMMTIMENLRDSTQYVSNETDKEILKVLTKEQAENFKAETERNDQFAMMPPPVMGGAGFPQNMPCLNHNIPNMNRFGQGMQQQNQQEPGLPGQCQPEQDFMGDQDDASGPDVTDPDLLNADDLDSLQDLDIFDLMNILE